MNTRKMDDIKQEVDRTGYSVHVYKSDGYKGYCLIFQKNNDKYCVYNHLSTESGYEEDLDDVFVESANFYELFNELDEFNL